MRFLLITALLYSSFSNAKLPQAPAEVEIINESDVLTYENIPTIKKLFKGARDADQRQALERDCQNWVSTEVSKAEAPYFRAFCVLTKDIVIREYRYTGTLLIKNWR